MSLPELSHEEIRRYSRHLLLDDVGMEGQRRLKSSSVLCIGSGGLGSPLLMYLAAAGVGTIGIVDDDVVDESNLQRQVVHATEAVGTPKVDSARARIAQINPLVGVITHKLRLDATNALELVRPYDLVVDGSDNFPTRYLVNDACVLCGKPLVYGAVQRFEGQLSVFNYCGGPHYRDLFPEPPPAGSVPSCAEAGVVGVLPGVIGVLQATEALKVLLGRSEAEVLSGRLLVCDAAAGTTWPHGLEGANHAGGRLPLCACLGGCHRMRARYDAMAMRFSTINFKKRADAPAVTQLSSLDAPCADAACGPRAALAAAEPFARVGVLEARRRMEHEGWQPFVLDVRTQAEARIVSLPFVDLQQPHRKVLKVAAQLPAEGRDILVHCKSGVRSAAACHALAAHGLSRLYNLDGGILGWARQVDPTMPTY